MLKEDMPVPLRDAHIMYIRWLLSMRDLSPHTLRAYDCDLGTFERSVGGEIPVGEIDRTHIVEFVEWQRDAQIASRSLRRRISALRGFFGWLATAGHIERSPWEGLRVDAGRPRRLPRVVPRDDLDRLLHRLRCDANLATAPTPGRMLDEPHHATTLLALVIMLVTGLRVSEVVGLRPRDVDIDGRSVRVVGKGLRERTVFLPNDWVAGLIDAYLATRDAMGISHDLLLFNRRGNPLTASTVRSRLVRVANASGVSCRVTPHMLRHTAATQLIEAGVDIRFIQRLLGHASLTTTELYTHVSDRSLQQVVAAADVLGRVLARDN